MSVKRNRTANLGGVGLICGLSVLMLSGCVQPLPSKLNTRGRTLSVCELSLNFAAYARQTITVRGIYYSGLRQRCPQVCPSGQPWPSALDLVDSKFAGENGVRVPFSTDQAGWDSLDLAALRAADGGEKAEVWTTVEGYLVVPLKSSLGPCDLAANGMFGGLHARGWHGGYVVVHRIHDVEVRRNAAAGYDYSIFRRKPQPE
jgi:hypothetical protein